MIFWKFNNERKLERIERITRTVTMRDGKTGELIREDIEDIDIISEVRK